MANDTVSRNGDDMAGFIVSDARRRLQAIEEPKYGRKYRRIIVAGLLGYNINSSGMITIIDVGVGQSTSSKRHGLYIELGTKTDPAHPFLRPAVFENKHNIVELLTR